MPERLSKGIEKIVSSLEIYSAEQSRARVFSWKQTDRVKSAIEASRALRKRRNAQWLFDNALLILIDEQVAGDGIALTRSVLQTFAVDDVDVAATVLNDAAVLEAACSQRDAGAARAQHVG